MSWLGDIGRGIVGAITGGINDRYGTGGWQPYSGSGPLVGYPPVGMPAPSSSAANLTQWAILAGVLAVVVLLILKR